MMWPRTAVLLLLPAVVVLANCGRAPSSSSAPASSASAIASAPLAGVEPHKEGALSASDRPGAPAIGAIEAGQASGGASIGKPAEPTAGDGQASSPASAPAGTIK